jgi:hypothetical protein
MSNPTKSAEMLEELAQGAKLFAWPPNSPSQGSPQ